jgi:hypothetical protein
MKAVVVFALFALSSVSCTFMETQVKNIKINFSVILNALGNVTTLTALRFAIQYVNPLNAILHVLNPKMLSVM